MKKNILSKNLIKIILNKQKSLLTQNDINKIKVGNLVSITYLITDRETEKNQTYTGLIISKNNNLQKTFKLRQIIEGIGVEQTFLINSPRILSISIKQSFKIKRAKLYFLRSLNNKSIDLKPIL